MLTPVNKIYLKLIERGAPFSFIRILRALYSGLQCAVVWSGIVGYRFDVKCGVRQGGVLSPHLFRLDALALSVITTATWLAGWLAGWLSVTAGIVSNRLNVSENFFDHLIAPS